MSLESVGYRSLPDLAAVVRAGRSGRALAMPAESNTDALTAQTIARMCECVNESVADPLTQAFANEAVRRFGYGSRDPRAIAWGVWWLVKHTLKFVQDNSAAWDIFRKRDAVELLISPAAMLRCRQTEGDCDDFTMMVCALLACEGVPFEIVTVAASPETPQDFSHVFCRAVMPDGSRMPLDASHGLYPGWTVPKSRIYRMQIWDANAQPIADQAPLTWDGLHGYRWNRGMGDGSTDDNTPDQLDLSSFDPQTGANASTAITSAIVAGPSTYNASNVPPIGSSVGCQAGYVVADSSGNCALASTVTGAQPGASNLDNALTSLATTWSKIAGTVIAPTTTVCNSAGTCVTGPSGSTSTTAAASAALSAIPTTTWLLLAAIAAGVFIFSKK